MKTELLFSLVMASSLPLLAFPRPDPGPREDLAVPQDAGLEVPELGDLKRAVGFLGVSAMNVPAALADQLKIDHGVTLSTVVPASPAARAGLRVGDIILQVGEKKVANMLDLSRAIKAFREGDRVNLKVIQNGKQVKKRVTLAALPQPRGGIGGAGAGLRVLPGGGFGLPGGGLRFGWGGGAGQFRMGDEEGSVEMKGSGEGREVIVRDRGNKVVFEGPWVTPQDKAAAPPDIRKRIGRVAGMFGGDGGFRRLDLLPDPLPRRAVPAPPPAGAPLLPRNAPDNVPAPAPEAGEDPPAKDRD